MTAKQATGAWLRVVCTLGLLPSVTTEGTVGYDRRSCKLRDFSATSYLVVAPFEAVALPDELAAQIVKERLNSVRV